MVREITLWPSRDLITKAAPAVLDEYAATALIDLEDTMDAASGLGISSTQVHDTWRYGVPLALIVVIEDTRELEKQGSSAIPLRNRRVWRLANPKIISASAEKVFKTEGCLSIPDYYERIERSVGVVVEADELHEDKTWEKITLTASGVLAHALQHEIDHLEGSFFVEEHGSPLKIDRARRYASSRWQKRGVLKWRPGPPTKEDIERATAQRAAKVLESSRKGFRR